MYSTRAQLEAISLLQTNESLGLGGRALASSAVEVWSSIMDLEVME